MDIQTQDGILLRGIPDGTPDEVIKQRIATIRAGSQSPAPIPSGPATPEHKLQASAPMRFIQGMRDPIDAGAQVLSHIVPDSVTRVLDAPGRYLRNSNSPLLQTIGDRFFADPTAAATDKRIAEDEQKYQAARQATAAPTLSGLVTGQNDPGTDWARFAGNVASPANYAAAKVLPISAATVPKMAATGAGVGAVGGALTPVTEGDFWSKKGMQTAFGAGAGAVLTPALGKLTEAVAPRISAFFERNFSPETLGAKASLKTDEAIKAAFAEIGADMNSVPQAYMTQLRQEVANSLKQGKLPDVAAMMRAKDFAGLGIKPLEGQITRDATTFARERNLRAVPNIGEPLMNRFTEQNQRLQSLVGGYGGPQAIERQAAGNALADALRAGDEQAQKSVSAAYKAARESTGKEAVVPLENLAKSYVQVVDDFADKVPTAIMNKFNELVLDPVTGKADYARRFTVEDGDKLIKAINDHVTTDVATNRALDKLRNAVKSAVTEQGDDVFEGARKLAAQRFKLHDALPALSAVVEGRASPDKFVSQYIINADTSKVRLLAQALNTNPLAFKEARNQVGAYLEQAAFGQNLTGDKILTPERLAKALRDLGSEKLKIFYSPQEVEQLHKIARVGAYINQAPAAAPVLGNPNMAWAGQMLGRIPGVGPAAQLASALKRSATNAIDVNASMAAKIPQQASELSPEVVRRLALSRNLLGYGGGAVVGSQMQ